MVLFKKDIDDAKMKLDISKKNQKWWLYWIAEIAFNHQYGNSESTNGGGGNNGEAVSGGAPFTSAGSPAAGKSPQQRPQKQQQQLSNTSVAVPKGTSTAGGGNNSSSSANVGHPNKSKVMHDLFGIETTDGKSTSSSSDLMASTSR